MQRDQPADEPERSVGNQSPVLESTLSNRMGIDWKILVTRRTEYSAYAKAYTRSRPTPLDFQSSTRHFSTFFWSIQA